jgi:hypothetical protein
MLGLPAMTPIAVFYTVIVGLFTCFFFWLLSPTLDRIREKWRERMMNAPLTPATEVAMLQQLRWQQASLRRLEQFRANQVDAILYVIGLLGTGLLSFVLAVYLYPLHIQPLSLFPAIISLVFFITALIEARNMTDKNIGESLTKLKKRIEELKVKLKVAD